MQGRTVVIPKITSKERYVGFTNSGNILVLIDYRDFDTSDVPDKDDSSFRQLAV
jgi:hypothetical protein